jgi:hypothetical protein
MRRVLMWLANTPEQRVGARVCFGVLSGGTFSRITRPPFHSHTLQARPASTLLLAGCYAGSASTYTRKRRFSPVCIVDLAATSEA